MRTWQCNNCQRNNRNGNRQQGLVWISGYTAITEVALFRAVLHMVFGASSATAISEARGELIRLCSLGASKRSEQCFRKGLNVYARLAIKNIPQWLFRCSNCSIDSGEGVYDRQLAFDGLQVGHRKTKLSFDDDEREFILQEPIQRNIKGSSEAYLIRSRGLRAIILDAMRARSTP